MVCTVIPNCIKRCDVDMVFVCVTVVRVLSASSRVYVTVVCVLSASSLLFDESDGPFCILNRL